MIRVLQTTPWPHDLPPQAEMDGMLLRTKGQLFFEEGAGFLGSLLCAHELVWDFSEPTAWDNGEIIGFNPYFYLSLGDRERVTLLAHEVYHTAFDHFTRLEDTGRCPDKWNEAADYAINLILDNFGYSFKNMNPLLNAKYSGMSTEEIYDTLPIPPKGKPLNPGDIGSDLRKPPEGSSQMDRITKIVAATQASRLAGDKAGTIPGEIELMVDEFLNPKLPWEVLLKRYFTALSNDDYSWKRPSRRYDEDYLPSLMGENGLEHLIYYLDVSGSVSDGDIQRFNSEVKFIHDDLTPKKLTLVTFDEKIQNIYEFTDDDTFEKIKVIGRGGTKLDEVYDHIKKHKPTAAVIFSDLHVKMMPNPRVPVLWVVVGNKSAKPPFGKTIHIDNE